MVPSRILVWRASLLVLLPLAGLHAQGRSSSVQGRVLDAATREPLPFVVVDLFVPNEEDRRAETDAEGRFEVRDLPPQLIRVRLRLIGYRTLDRGLNLSAGRVTRATWELERQEVVLPEVRVEETAPTTVLMLEFEERRRVGIGTFYGVAELERMRARNVADLVREAPGVRVIRSPTNEQFAVSNRRVIGGPGRGGDRECFMQVVVDGMILWSPDAGGEVTFRSGPPPDIGRLLSTSELAGVEIYNGMVTMPIEYRREGSDCGTVVFWTRRGSMRARGN